MTAAQRSSSAMRCSLIASALTGRLGRSAAMPMTSATQPKPLAEADPPTPAGSAPRRSVRRGCAARALAGLGVGGPRRLGRPVRAP
jgi:hypothetical protein